MEGGEVARVVAHSAGFAKRPPPAESLYLQVKEDVDLRRGPIPWAYLSMCLNSGSPGPLGSRVRRLCVALCWSLGAVPAARAGQSGLLPSAGQEARLGGDPGCKRGRKTTLGVEPRGWRAFFGVPRSFPLYLPSSKAARMWALQGFADNSEKRGQGA